MRILLTGGLGFIGSHIAIELVNSGYEVVIVDNLSNSSITVLDRLKKITNTHINFYQGDICDKVILNNIFKNENIYCVIHLAAYKAVKESVDNPLKYYKNNIVGLITLLDSMEEYNVNKIIFSSSATVYNDMSPLIETSLLKPINPYGQTKLMGETILQDIISIDVIILRYFNPVGCHESGLIGDNPKEPNNLFPYIMKVINNEKDYLTIFGNDYNTPDGTAIRDYIHVCDLAKAHVKAIHKIDNKKRIYNLGTGKGYSVLDIVNTFNKYCNNKIIYIFGDRREGDAEVVYADCQLANKELEWVCENNLDDMIIDTLNFV